MNNPIIKPEFIKKAKKEIDPKQISIKNQWLLYAAALKGPDGSPLKEDTIQWRETRRAFYWAAWTMWDMGSNLIPSLGRTDATIVANCIVTELNEFIEEIQKDKPSTTKQLNP
jgi:hypothetical protein